MTSILPAPSPTSVSFEVGIEVCRGADWNYQQYGVTTRETVHVEMADATKDGMKAAVADVVSRAVGRTTSMDGPLAFVDYRPSHAISEGWEGNDLLWDILLDRHRLYFLPAGLDRGDEVVELVRERVEPTTALAA
jgi:hypothetical protein